MQSFQSRTLAAIAERIEACGLETSQQADWGNTGRLYGHRKGQITPALTIGYNFQAGSYTLTITEGARRVPSQVGRGDYFDFHHDPVTATTRFWECLYTALAACAPAKRARRRA